MRLTLILAGILCLSPAFAEEIDTSATARDQVVDEYDVNHDGRLKGKEMKALRDARPKTYANLVDWCETAKENPSGHGVSLSADAKGKDKKCKKSHVAPAFVEAWAALGKKLYSERPDIKGGITITP